MAGVISPKRESAMTMPIGPMIRSASRQATRTGFSPVAPMAAPAFIIAAVAVVRLSGTEFMDFFYEGAPHASALTVDDDNFFHNG